MVWLGWTALREVADDGRLGEWGEERWEGVSVFLDTAASPC